MMMIPAGTVQSQLRALLRNGRTPEQATSEVMGPYGRVLADAGNDSLVGYARPAVLTEARRLRRQLERRQEDRAFQAAPGTRERAQLADMSFHLHDGTVVSWADATAEQHQARILWLETYIGSLETDMRRHERARKLLENEGAERLSDINGWESLIGDDADEEIPVDDDASTGAEP